MTTYSKIREGRIGGRIAKHVSTGLKHLANFQAIHVGNESGCAGEKTKDMDSKASFQ